MPADDQAATLTHQEGEKLEQVNSAACRCWLVGKAYRIAICGRWIGVRCACACHKEDE